MIKSSGYQHTFLYFGIGQGLVLLILGWFLAQPSGTLRLARAGSAGCGSDQRPTRKEFHPRQMLLTPVFFRVMYAMFVMMAVGGLMATAQLGPIALDFHVADVPVSLVGLTLPALTFALSLDRLLNGITPAVLWLIWDYVGRENTMFLALASCMEGVGIILLSHYGRDLAFVVLDLLRVLRLGRDLQLIPRDLR